MRAGLEAFAATRRSDQTALEEALLPLVKAALRRFGTSGWYDELLATVRDRYGSIYTSDGGKGEPHDADTFVSDVADTLDKTTRPDSYTAERIATWLATALLNAASQEAGDRSGDFVVFEWVTMHDDKVRPMHAEADGQQRPAGEPFEVCGQHARFPGDPRLTPDCFINCRCALAPVAADQAASTVYQVNASEETTMTTTVDEQATDIMPLSAVPWHGVLAPEGVWSGDGRSFAAGSLSMADLPLPLTWQKVSADGHDGSVVVAKIEKAAKVGNEMRGSGHFLMIPEADEAIGLVSEFGRFGVSVDADSIEAGLTDEAGRVEFSNARIRSASIVPIPAFPEAWVMLGEAPPGYLGDECDPTDPEGECYDPAAVAASLESFVSDKPWSQFKQSDYTPAQWKSACVMHLDPAPVPMSNHKLPIKEPGGALNRNGVHAAAARFNQTQGPASAKSAAKAALRSAYSTLGEQPPDVLKASLDETFGRGPGWITNPEATKKIHDYWTVPGEEGYDKIGWGTDGDFYRCKAQIGQEIAEQDPETVARWMNQICAQWHHDATGFWPGHAPAETSVLPQGDQAPAVSLVASGVGGPPAEWFADPGFTSAMPLVVDDDGRIYGHLAEWSTCHTGYPGMCVTPPRSASNYAYFRTGYVVCNDGSRVAVGQITLGGGHAAGGRMRGAVAHYDNTCTAVADIACGEDEFGIWVAGALRGDISEADLHTLRAQPLSGDWRQVGADPDNLEMIAALCVNVQGFPVPRIGIENGVQVSLVAAGVLGREEVPKTWTEFVSDLADTVIDEIAARDARRMTMSVLASRVWGGEHPASAKAKMEALAARVGGQ